MLDENMVSDVELMEEDGNMPVSKEEVQNVIAMNESDIIKGMIAASEYKEDEASYKQIRIERGGKTYFSFRIRPLSDEEIDLCRERATKYVRNKKYGNVKMPEDTNAVKFRNLKIYHATVDEDKKKTWDNKVVMDRLNVLDPLDVIELCLIGGEKETVVDAIDQISGFNDGMTEVAKN